MARESIPTNAIGRRIRARRKALGLTLAQVAEFVGVTHAAVSFWELREPNITAENLLKLSAVLRMDPFEIMGQVEMNPAPASITVDRLADALEILVGFTSSKRVVLNSKVKAKVLGYLCQSENVPTDGELSRLTRLAT